MTLAITDPRGRQSGPDKGTWMAPEPDAVLTIEEFAEYPKISKSTLYKLAQEGRIPAQKVGKHWRFRKAAIDRWLDESGGRTCDTTGKGEER